MNLGARLLKFGAEVKFLDMNLVTTDDLAHEAKWANIVGFTVLGAPYIPQVMEYIKVIQALRDQGVNVRAVVGGEGASRLKRSDFENWLGDFVDGVMPATKRGDFPLFPGTIPSMFETSMGPMLETLNETQQELYLGREFCLFLSQGCKFNCAFCVAAKARPEAYRDMDALKDELETICRIKQKLGHRKIEVYLSNLDGLQSPKRLEESLSIFAQTARAYKLEPFARCLATSRCSKEATDADPELLERLRDYGLHTIAIGADGASKETWARQRKTHNNESDLLVVIDRFKNAKIVPEILMVCGYQSDTLKDLWAVVAFSFREALRGAVIRPYLAKSELPGGEAWTDDSQSVVSCRKDAKLLKHLDFAMFGSSETHPNWKNRLVANICYALVTYPLMLVGKCPNRPLFPVPRGFMKWPTELLNRLIPFDR